MAAKISDLGVAKILQINPAEMSHMTQTPGTQSYMAPETLRPNPRYDIEVDVFSFGVMLVHVLSGQWPMPNEATQVDPQNPAHVIGLSEVERRAEYLNVIGHPSDNEEGHPLMPLIERCLSNSPNLRPNASELVDAMSDAATQQPLTFSNRVEMMQRINSIQREKETMQVRVLELERQMERTEVVQGELRERNQRQEMALTVELEQLRLQVDNLEAEKTHIITTSTAREELHHIDLAAKERQYQTELSEKQKQLDIKERGFEEGLKKRDDQLQVKTTELSSQTTLITQQRSTIDGLHSQLQKVRHHLLSGTQVILIVVSNHVPYGEILQSMFSQILFRKIIQILPLCDTIVPLYIKMT